jgi:hypothetical protein
MRQVTMSIVLPKYEMVEFSWEKECGARIVTAPKVCVCFFRAALKAYLRDASGVHGQPADGAVYDVDAFDHRRARVRLPALQGTWSVHVCVTRLVLSQKRRSEKEKARLAALRAQEETETY